jgi:ABC-type uncharacterized transport system substrate-binding protein
MLNRRASLCTASMSLLAAPRAVEAQTAGKVPTIGLLFPASEAASRTQDEAFRQGLREHGYVEGQNLMVVRSYADGDPDCLAREASELVRSGVDILVAAASTAALAAKRATATIPIVFASANDPIGVGLVASLARPGGNVTGVTPMSADLIPKRLELLKETVPGLARIGILS